MSYTLNIATGVVSRDSDGVVVCPTQSAESPDFIGYTTWVGQGNHPTEINVPAGSTSMKITRLAFRNRFTMAEKAAMEIVALDDPSGTMEARQAAATLRALLKDLDNSRYIDLARTDLQQGVGFIMSLGIITAERYSEILTTPPTLVEQIDEVET